MNLEDKRSFYGELMALAVYVVMCLDEIVKVPFIPRRYRKYLWLKNLTTEEAQAAAIG